MIPRNHRIILLIKKMEKIFLEGIFSQINFTLKEYNQKIMVEKEGLEEQDEQIKEESVLQKDADINNIIITYHKLVLYTDIIKKNYLLVTITHLLLFINFYFYASSTSINFA